MEAWVLTVWRRAAELPGWLKAVMLGQLVSSAGALAWLYLTLYLVEDRGLSPAKAGLAAAAYGVGLLAGNLGGGWFGDRFGLRTGALGSLLSWSAACALMPVVPGGPPLGGLRPSTVGRRQSSFRAVSGGR